MKKQPCMRENTTHLSNNYILISKKTQAANRTKEDLALGRWAPSRAVAAQGAQQLRQGHWQTPATSKQQQVLSQHLPSHTAPRAAASPFKALMENLIWRQESSFTGEFIYPWVLNTDMVKILQKKRVIVLCASETVILSLTTISPLLQYTHSLALYSVL